MERQIVYYYQRGIASYLIAKKIGKSNNYVRGVLKKHGVLLRGRLTTNRMSASKRTPEQNKEITKAAAEANIGSIHSNAHRIKLAKSREKSPAIDPVYEKPLVSECKKRGVFVVPQKAFGKFNVDLYLPKENIIIEIFGGGYHNKKEAVKMFNNKMRYLSRLDVRVAVVWANKGWNPSKVLAMVLKTKNPLLIINGEGKETKQGRKDITL